MRIHSLLSSKCRVGDSAIAGQGVFALEPLAKDELVVVWGGKVCTSAEIARLAKAFPHIESHAVSVAEGYHLTSENLFEFDDSEYINHCCEPNLGVRGQILVVARRPIAAGEELTFDYETTETSMVSFACLCGSKSCRRVIDGSAWQDPAFVARNREYLSWHILERLVRGDRGLDSNRVATARDGPC